MFDLSSHIYKYTLYLNILAISWYNFHGDQMLSSVWTIVLSQRLKIRLCFIAHYILYYFLKRSAQLDDFTRVKEHNPLKIQVPTKTCHQEFFYIRFIEYRARLEMTPCPSADQIKTDLLLKYTHSLSNSF